MPILHVVYMQIWVHPYVPSQDPPLSARDTVFSLRPRPDSWACVYPAVPSEEASTHSLKLAFSLIRGGSVCASGDKLVSVHCHCVSSRLVPHTPPAVLRRKATQRPHCPPSLLGDRQRHSLPECSVKLGRCSWFVASLCAPFPCLFPSGRAVFLPVS